MSNVERLRWAAAKAQLELLGYKHDLVVPEAHYVPGQTFAYVPYIGSCYILTATSDRRVYWDHHQGNGKRDLRIPVGALEAGSEDYEYWRRKVFDNFPNPARELYEKKLLDELWVYIWTLADNMATDGNPAKAAAYLAHVVFQQMTFVLDHYPTGDKLRLKGSATGEYYGDPILVSQLVKHCAFGSELTQWIICTAYAVFNGKEDKKTRRTRIMTKMKEIRSYLETAGFTWRNVGFHTADGKVFGHVYISDRVTRLGATVFAYTSGVDWDDYEWQTDDVSDLVARVTHGVVRDLPWEQELTRAKEKLAEALTEVLGQGADEIQVSAAPMHCVYRNDLVTLFHVLVVHDTRIDYRGYSWTSTTFLPWEFDDSALERTVKEIQRNLKEDEND